MRVRLDRYQTLHRSIRLRALVLLVLGAIGVVVSSFAMLMGLLMLIMPGGGLWEERSGMVIGIFAGLFPLVGAVLMMWRGVVGRRRLHRLGDLAALARHTPTFGSEDVVHTLHLRPQDAERLVIDATALGLLEVDDPILAPSAPPGLARSAVLGPTQPGDALARTTPAGAPAGPNDPWVGSVLNGTYRVEEHIGVGGMGSVYAARHLRTGRRYAVKTLLADARLSPDAIRRFKREATAASALGHPHIVGVHDFNETAEGVHYLVMDLLEGETLEQRLARIGSLVWSDARRLALELGLALVTAHDLGLLHRDLKPANIFLARAADGWERAILVDFGLAKSIDGAAASRITVTGAAVGTPLYMSPEQARGEPVDVRTDVYGLAAVVYEMVTGAPPFLDRTLATVYARLLTQSVAAASSVARTPVPRTLDGVLFRALAKLPGERYPDMRALMNALTEIPPALPEAQRAG